MSGKTRKSSITRKLVVVLVGLGIITGLMCYLNLMAYGVLGDYNASLREKVAELSSSTDEKAVAIFGEAEKLLDHIDVKISGTYLFDNPGVTGKSCERE